LSSVERYKSTSKKRLELVCFYESSLGQTSYNRRRISIEPLIEHVKSVFRIDPIIGKRISDGTYNCTNPKSIKYMLGTGY
jgi:hypothetical protein